MEVFYTGLSPGLWGLWRRVKVQDMGSADRRRGEWHLAPFLAGTELRAAAAILEATWATAQGG